MTRWLPLLAMSVVIAAHCAGCQPIGSRPAAPSSAYYPLAVGSKWIFRGPDHQRILKVVKHETVDGKHCALVRTSHDDKVVAEEHIFVNEKGVFGWTSNGENLPAPLPILRLPPTPGRTWRVNFTKNRKKSQGLYSLENDKVTVPYGSFDAVKLIAEIYAGGKRQVRFVNWFAKDVGIVKQVHVTPEQTQVYELIQFDKIERPND